MKKAAMKKTGRSARIALLPLLLPAWALAQATSPAPATPTASDVSAAVSGLEKIALGEYTMFFLVNGRIEALGSNRAGEAGFPATHGSAAVPAQEIAAPPGIRFVDVACGGYQSVAVDDTGHVWAWGFDNYGSMGNGIADNVQYLPAKVATDMEGNPFGDVIAVKAGFHFFAALKKDGSVWVWGLSGNDHIDYDSSGLVGNGDKTGQNVVLPSRVIFPEGVTIVKISAGWIDMLALDGTGTVWSWGGGEHGAVNRGTDAPDYATPAKLSQLPAGIQDITAGSDWNYAVDSHRDLWGWGLLGGELGLGQDSQNHYPSAPAPVKLDFPDLNGRVKEIVVSELSTHVLRDDGTLWGWGSNPRGEVGTGEMKDWANTTPPYAWDWGRYENMVPKPVQVLDHVEHVYGGTQAAYVYVLETDGTLWSWGRNKTGVLGNATSLPPSQEVAKFPDKWDVPTPTQIKPLN